MAKKYLKKQGYVSNHMIKRIVKVIDKYGERELIMYVKARIR